MPISTPRWLESPNSAGIIYSILAALTLHRGAGGIAGLAECCKTDTPLASPVERVDKPTDKGYALPLS